MYSINSRVLNDLAASQPLKSPLGRELFPLKQEALNAALEQREQRLAAAGVPARVAVAYLHVAPLLWENQAISAYLVDHQDLENVLPNLESVGEATLLATQEYHLNQHQQAILSTLLQAPPR